MAAMHGKCQLFINHLCPKAAAARQESSYKYQPNLEGRHAQLKGHQLVAPVFLKDPVRIDGLLCCHFFALVTQALIEREIRAGMKTARHATIPLYPELRECAALSSILYFVVENPIRRSKWLLSRSG